MQENWIWKSTGAEVEFEVIGGKKITVFTTRPETLFGDSFIGISPRHPLAQSLVEANSDIANFVRECNASTQKDLDTQEKKGIFTGLYAINPVFQKEIIDTKGLQFRPLQNEDETEIEAILETADEYLSQKRGNAKYYINLSKEDYSSVGYGFDAIILNGKIIGFGGLIDGKHKSRNGIEFGFVLHSGFQGKGFGAAILKHYTNKAFNELNAKKLCASVDIDNISSIKVC